MYADRLFNALERNDPEPGQLLVAAPGIEEPFFVRSVMLIIDQDRGVTCGVDLTKRSDIAVFNVLPDWAEVVAKPQALYVGGPINPQSVLGVGMTKRGVSIEEHSALSRLAPRLAHVDLREKPKVIGELMTGMRMFAGYTAWENDQLEREIANGDWYVAPALAQDALAPGAADVWGDVMKRQPMPLPLYSTFPASSDDN